eukprot:GHUV01021589.1.p1 GENE.GHUV01021589.1~~GHUV01021589.1.p1  ORF type:complete len:115 (+),score=20.41 GHUV01021589.1:174-518(+)
MQWCAMQQGHMQAPKSSLGPSCKTQRITAPETITAVAEAVKQDCPAQCAVFWGCLHLASSLMTPPRPAAGVGLGWLPATAGVLPARRHSRVLYRANHGACITGNTQDEASLRRR